MAAKIKKGDEVVVLKGRDKGRKGEVMRMFTSDRRAIVQGVNMVKRHTKPRPGEPGGIVEKEAPIDLSRVAMVDPKSGEPTRIGFRFLEDGRKVRYAKRSGEVLDM